MLNRLRIMPMFALLLGASIMVAASLGCSSGENKSTPPKGAPEGELAEPTVETPEATEAEKPAEGADEMPAEGEKGDAEKADEKEMPAEEQAEKTEEGEKPAAKEPAPEDKPEAKPEEKETP